MARKAVALLDAPLRWRGSMVGAVAYEMQARHISLPSAESPFPTWLLMLPVLLSSIHLRPLLCFAIQWRLETAGFQKEAAIFVLVIRYMMLQNLLAFVFGMDPFGVLTVRFHYGGEFLTVAGHLQYFGGNTGLSSIELDKLSLPELIGHLRDHVDVDHPVQLHWLYLGEDLGVGLRLLVDDHSCNVIPEHIIDGGVADIFVEDIDTGKRRRIQVTGS
ncbi:hypothetical protein EJB05_47262, partial [Eragrostis curvula]